MKYAELEKRAKKELAEDAKALAVENIKLRLLEIDEAEAVLKEMKKQYSALLKEKV